MRPKTFIRTQREAKAAAAQWLENRFKVWLFLLISAASLIAAILCAHDAPSRLNAFLRCMLVLLPGAGLAVDGPFSKLDQAIALYSMSKLQHAVSVGLALFTVAVFVLYFTKDTAPNWGPGAYVFGAVTILGYLLQHADYLSKISQWVTLFRLYCSRRPRTFNEFLRKCDDWHVRRKLQDAQRLEDDDERLELEEFGLLVQDR